MRIKRVKPYNGAVGPVYQIWELIAYTQGHILSMHAQLPSGNRGLIVGMNLHLFPYFMYGSS